MIDLRFCIIPNAPPSVAQKTLVVNVPHAAGTHKVSKAIDILSDGASGATSIFTAELASPSSTWAANPVIALGEQRINTISLEDDSSAPQFAEDTVIVEFTATFEGVTKEVFLISMSAGYKAGVAAASNVAVDQVSITSVTSTRRRAGSIVVATAVSAPAEVREVLETTIIAAQSSGRLESSIATEIKASTGADSRVTLVLSAPKTKVILKTGELAPTLAATSTPQPAQALADPTDSSTPSGLNMVLIGGAVGGVLGALLIVGLAWQVYVMYKRRSSKVRPHPTSLTSVTEESGGRQSREGGAEAGSSLAWASEDQGSGRRASENRNGRRASVQAHDLNLAAFDGDDVSTADGPAEDQDQAAGVGWELPNATEPVPGMGESALTGVGGTSSVQQVR